MSKILIIDDEEELVELLKDELHARGHEVLTAYDGIAGINLAEKHPDLILLDVMLPASDGFTVCRTIREKVLCPILFMSARQSEADRVRGLTLGGDDYIVKPFTLRELMARIEANLRREQRAHYVNKEQKRTKLYFGILELNLIERTLTINNQNIILTRREYDIVEFLGMHSGQVFSREQIYEKIWGYDADGDSNTVVEHIKKIRSKLHTADSETEYLSTVWGIGYKWNKIRGKDAL
ncbi:DNA-binding response regulator [Anaerocolumna cellulosilytica]|uniref:Stage 0 sporulation protein A homolog n=1 Tax=Anaerocolumna cellulosilytica TaxID=433286 RepID=A0A6S6R028_9FIRM|nr:response regulator transcription factor [Anaerocolumna cellulosilytica]MBB5194138.1 DNA-binding response OmpR family regulator [Anaerocolumna cellulosilytica]BCJ94649.1 DNA-binding response regulator [Anaerocolumna cellulosilytica]